jgi:hypothetical protein
MRRVVPLVLTALLSAAPALAQGRPDARKAEIEALLAALKQAPNETIAAAMEARVRQLWLQAGSPAATMLMNRGTRDLNNNADSDAWSPICPTNSSAVPSRALGLVIIGAPWPT